MPRPRGLMAAIALIVAACGGDGSVVDVYTTLEPELVSWLGEAYGAAHPGVTLRFTPLSSGDVVARLVEERDTPNADLVLGAPSWVLAEAAGRDLLSPDLPSWTPTVPAERRDAGGRWVGWLIDPLVLAFDHDALSRTRAPRDWLDLAHPRWTGALLMPEPGLDDGATLLLLTRAAASLAEYGDPLDAIDWFTRLDAQRSAYFTDETSVLDRFGRGREVIAPVRSSVAERVRVQRPAVDWVAPESSTPLLVQGLALVRGAADAEAALDFAEWLGSDDVAAALAGRLHRIPAWTTSGDDRPSWIADALSSRALEVTPADTLAAHRDTWLARWRTDAKGKGTRILIP